MENLRAWLNGCRDYTSGVTLYAQYGKDPALKRMFSEAESPFKKKRLQKALEELWAKRLDKRVALATNIINTAQAIAGSFSTQEKSKAPQPIKPTVVENTTTFLGRSNCHV